MLFKRIIEGKSMLNANTKKTTEKCSRRKSECEGCWEHSAILEELMKVVFLGVVLWVGIALGSYPFNLTPFPDSMSHPPPLYDFPFPSAHVLKRLPPITKEYINESVELSKLGVERLRTLEENLQTAGITPKPGSQAKALLLYGYPTEEAMHYYRSSQIIEKTSKYLVDSKCINYGLDEQECASYISTLNLPNGEFRSQCIVLEGLVMTKSEDNPLKIRTFDGSHNNPSRPSWGQALTGYKRLLHPRYGNGIDKPREAASGAKLPSPLIISSSLTGNLDRPNPDKTIALAVWAQFILHDMVHTPVRKTIHTNVPIRCCESGRMLAPRHLHPSCFPITVPGTSPHSPTACSDYVRSLTTYRGDCTFGAAEQMNQATHYLDASHVYGSSAAAAKALTGADGLLATSTVDGEEFPPLGANAGLCAANARTCFNISDGRANVMPWMSALHTVWAREHNRVARALAGLNPSWPPYRLYHEARAIVIAEIQHITYRHWLHALTGQSLEQLLNNYDKSYNPDVNPTISNSFATAGLHFAISMLDQDIQLVDEEYRVTSTERLSDHYFRPDLVTLKGKLKEVVRGMITQRSQLMDLNYDEDLRVRWLGGVDALAAAAQRGRDHGLPPYTHYRALRGLPHASAWHHLADSMPAEIVDKLAALYENPNDVDLVVGAMAETPLPGSLLGPTFTYILAEQLHRSRAGDRHFYSHSHGAAGWRRLGELRRASLARVLCDNAPLDAAPRDVFAPVSHLNPVVPCSEIKKVNLDLWKDSSDRMELLTRTGKWIRNKVVSADRQTANH